MLGVFLPQSDLPEDLTGGNKHDGKARVFLNTCATCHGEKGEGVRQLMTPSIASLPRWYIEEQIRKFSNGQRGDHPKDLNGQKMRAAISTLSGEEIAQALDYLETLPALNHVSILKGDADRGYQLYYDHCMACHRFNGHGEVVFKSASLNGLQDWYLLEQFNKFEHGIRGYHPDDESGHKMRESVAHISNHQDKIDILALLSGLAQKYPVSKNTKIQKPTTK